MLADPTLHQIFQTFNGLVIPYDHSVQVSYLNQPNIWQRVLRSAGRIIASDAARRDRSAERVTQCIAEGMIPEYVIGDVLTAAGLSTTVNDEHITGRYYYDLETVVDGQKLLLELKYQSPGSTNFSFSEREKIGMLVTHWQYYHLAIGYKVLNDQIRVWIGIDHRAFDPNLKAPNGYPYFRDSLKKENGMFLQDMLASEQKVGLSERLF